MLSPSSASTPPPGALPNSTSSSFFSSRRMTTDWRTRRGPRCTASTVPAPGAVNWIRGSRLSRNRGSPRRTWSPSATFIVGFSPTKSTPSAATRVTSAAASTRCSGVPSMGKSRPLRIRMDIVTGAPLRLSPALVSPIILSMSPLPRARAHRGNLYGRDCDSVSRGQANSASGPASRPLAASNVAISRSELLITGCAIFSGAKRLSGSGSPGSRRRGRRGPGSASPPHALAAFRESRSANR